MITDFVRDTMIKKVLKQTDFTTAPLYASLHTADPGLTGASEISDSLYARVQIPTTAWGASVAGVITTIEDIRFENMPATTVKFVGLWDDLDAGNFIGSWDADPNPAGVAVAGGDTFAITHGDLFLSFEECADSAIGLNIGLALQNMLWDKIARDVDFDTPTYISLHSTDPGLIGSAEISGSGYVRQLIAPAGWTSILSPPLTSENITQLDFTDLPASTLRFMGMFDAVTGGNFLMRAPLDDVITLAALDRFRFVAGGIVVIWACEDQTEESSGGGSAGPPTGSVNDENGTALFMEDGTEIDTE